MYLNPVILTFVIVFVVWAGTHLKLETPWKWLLFGVFLFWMLNQNNTSNDNNFGGLRVHLGSKPTQTARLIKGDASVQSSCSLPHCRTYPLTETSSITIRCMDADLASADYFRIYPNNYPADAQFTVTFSSTKNETMQYTGWFGDPDDSKTAQPINMVNNNVVSTEIRVPEANTSFYFKCSIGQTYRQQTFKFMPINP